MKLIRKKSHRINLVCSQTLHCRTQGGPWGLSCRCAEWIQLYKSLANLIHLADVYMYTRKTMHLKQWVQNKHIPNNGSFRRTTSHQEILLLVHKLWSIHFFFYFFYFFFVYLNFLWRCCFPVRILKLLIFFQ